MFEEDKEEIECLHEEVDSDVMQDLAIMNRTTPWVMPSAGVATDAQGTVTINEGKHLRPTLS